MSIQIIATDKVTEKKLYLHILFFDKRSITSQGIMKGSFNKWALREWDSHISSVFTMQHNSLLMNQKVDLVKIREN